MRKIALSLITFAALFCLISASAHAQATRTWVSGVGDDANPCSRTAPCKTFAGAISKTAAFGEINTLDPGGFGGVTITKSISIVNEGVGEAGVLVSGTNAIIINAGVNDVVTLRGLFIQGLGTGLNGINFLAGKALHVQNCVIMGFGSTAAGNGNGIKFSPNSLGSRLDVQDTTLSENFANGILVQPAVGGSSRTVLDRVHMENNNGNGFKADATNGAINATIRESVASGNGANGFTAFSPSANAAAVFIDHSAASNNVTNGILADGGAAGTGVTIRINNATVTGNGTGIAATNAVNKTASFGNTFNAGNGFDGAPNQADIPPQ